THVQLVRPVLGQHLDRDRGLEHVVAAEPDQRERAGAQPPFDGVPTDPVHPRHPRMMTHRTRRQGNAVDDTEELAQRAAAGDSAALDALLRRIQPEVLRRCARFLPHRQDAEEAAQDVLLQVARNIHRFEGRAKFSTWLHVIIANCSRQTYRSLKRRFAEQASAELPLERPDPRTTSVIAGSRLDLLDALDKLERDKPDLVAPIVLRDICQMEYNEIATHLGVPLGTVKSRIHAGRKHGPGSLVERYACPGRGRPPRPQTTAAASRSPGRAPAGAAGSGRISLGARRAGGSESRHLPQP